jgi:hypothetical protein
MPRSRVYADDAARHRAYRQRKRDATNRSDLGDLMEKLAFIRDTAGDVSRDSVRNWSGWRGSAEMHAHALQQDLDDLVARVDALIRGDSRAFDTAEFQAWRARARVEGTSQGLVFAQRPC